MVSVIVPVKDTPPLLLLRAVLSALEQKGTSRVEVVVWDDGSTDRDCRAALAGLKRTSRVVVGESRANKGISAARNAACDIASGEWLIWLDSDDVLPPGAVDALIASTTRSTLYVIGQCEVHLPGGTRVTHRNNAFVAQWSRSRRTLADPLLSTVFAVHGGMVRRGLFDDVAGFDERLRYAELTDWFLRTMAAVWPNEVAVVEAMTYNYHKRPDSHSADRAALEEHRKIALGRYATTMGWPDWWAAQFGERCATTGARFYDLIDADGTIRLKADHRSDWPTEMISMVPAEKAGRPAHV